MEMTKRGGFVRLNKSFTVILAVFFLFASLASAGITLTEPADSAYNIGMGVETSAVIIPDENVNGFFKVGIYCQGSEITYFVNLVSLKKSSQVLLPVSKLELFEGLNGTCNLKASVEDYRGTVSYSAFTKDFEVTNRLHLTISIPKQEFNPGEEVIVSAFVKDIQGKSLDSGSAKVSFLGNEASFDFTAGEFIKKIVLPSDLKSGKHVITIKVKDKYENEDGESINFSVAQIPTSITNDVEEDELKPGESVKVVPKLYDQAGDEIDASGTISVYDEDEKKIGGQSISTNQEFQFEIEDYSKPGEYSIKSEMRGVIEDTLFRVLEVKEISTALLGEEVIIKNIGNVKYVGGVIVSFAGKDKSIDVSLNPREEKRIQLNSGEGDVKVLTGSEERNLGVANIPERGLLPMISGKVTSIKGSSTFKRTVLGLLLVIIAVLIFLVIKRIRKNMKREEYQKRKDRDLEEGKAKLREMMEERSRKKTGTARLFPFASKIKEEDAKDFRDSMLKSINRDKENKGKGIFTKKVKTDDYEDGEGYRYIRAEPKTPSYYKGSSQEEEKGKKGGVFSMFS